MFNEDITINGKHYKSKRQAAKELKVQWCELDEIKD